MLGRHADGHFDHRQLRGRSIRCAQISTDTHTDNLQIPIFFAHIGGERPM
jgi:hypothetical protein